ncbi:FMN reductase, partial [Xanthomonas hyacinthi DSM 19077]
MSYPLNVVAVVGSTSTASRTLALAREELPAEIEQQLRRIESADLLVAAAPVHRGSYPGLFKHLFDLVHVDGLVETPVLLAATGGSERHALVIDHQLRPLFSFLQALTLPIGVYATQQDFDGEFIASAPLQERIALAVERAVGVLGRVRGPGLRQIA